MYMPKTKEQFQSIEVVIRDFQFQFGYMDFETWLIASSTCLHGHCDQYMNAAD